MRRVNLTKELKNNLYWENSLRDCFNKKKEIPNEEEFYKLQESVISHEWSYTHLVKIPKSDGKSLRDIYIFNEKDSLLQRIINGILYTKFTDVIDDSVFSYVKGKRTFHAAKHIQQKIKDKNLFGVKLDISNYFLSVDHLVIVKVLTDLIDDYDGFKLMFNLFDLNKFNYKGDEVEQFLSIMPGAAVSSFFANYILKDLDSYLVEETEAYARYSDDLIFFCKSEEELDRIVSEVTSRISKYGLSINPSKIKHVKDIDRVEFLGLEISKDEINVSDDFIKNVKSRIKSICKRDRTRFETSSNGIVDLRSTIFKINRMLYSEIFIPSLQHSSTRISYAFSNVTTWSKFQTLDYYVYDQLRFVYSGKHNKTLYSRLDTNEIDRLGYKSIVQMYNLFTVDREVYLNEVNVLMQGYNLDKRVEVAKTVDLNKIKFTFIDYVDSFSKLFYEVLSGGYFYFKGRKVFADLLVFDIEKKKIRFEDLILVEGNTVIVDEILCNLKGRDYKIVLNNCKLSSLTDKDPRTLMRFFLSSNCSEILERPYYKYKIFRKYKDIDLINKFPEDYLDFEMSINRKLSRFMSYLYFHLATNCLWSGYDYSRNFTIIKEDSFSLVLKKEWLG